MKVENFTIGNPADSGKRSHFAEFKGSSLGLLVRYGISILVFLAWNASHLSAQTCPLACNNNVQVSVDGNCMALITPDMILEGSMEQGCNYTVTLEDAFGNPIANPIDGSWIGETVKARVRLGANSCWGYLILEDKIDPMIDCPSDITIGCNEADPILDLNAAVSDNCDPNPQIVIVSDVVNDLDCSAMYSATRVVTFMAVDASGNESELCTQTIYYERATLADVVFPLDYNDAQGQLPSLQCDQVMAWDANNNGYPDPEETGVPTVDGYPLYPNDRFCEMNVTFSDQVIEICPGSFKVIRKWTVLDWCQPTNSSTQPPNPVMDFQIIKVLDLEGPIVTCPVDFTVTADPYTCTADVLMPAPILIFDCSEVTYSIAILFADNDGNPPVNGNYEGDDVILTLDQQMTLYDLPFGRTWIRYTLYDECGNTSNCFIEIDVIDEIPPIAVCDEHTVVSLTSSNTAHVYALTFDDGSHDNCSDVTFEVQRMGSNPCGPPFGWNDYVKFCCADVGNVVMVSLRVTDAFGNSNTCMVEVTVQDKLDPMITCPPDVTLDCNSDINDYNLTGQATGTDNCGDPVITHQDFGSIDNCGEGVIRRRWTATDGGGRTDICDQFITLIDLTPFNGNIIWPPNQTLSGCVNVDTDPSNTGVPIYNDDDCSLIADTYEDQTFEFVEGACLKILRTWTVIDWCEFNQANPSAGGLYQYTQVIKVHNTSAPVFGDQCADITVDGTSGNCIGSVTMVADADDDCTPDADLVWSYRVDVFNDGNTSNDFVGNSNIFSSSVVPFGTHKVTWWVEDMCGNIETCMQLFTVEDNKPPTPYCIGGITTVIMPNTGTITIWGSDFDLGSTDNCPGPLTFGIRPVGSTVNPQTGWTFDCDDVGVNEVEIWVYDPFGNSDFCNTLINIQANNGSCGGAAGGGPMIAGLISREDTDAVQDVMVMMEDVLPGTETYYVTQDDGHYEFHNVTANSDYLVSASRNDNYNNGVSTLDLVLMQKHILGVKPFDSPYKVIAADVNNSHSVSATDMVLLRKLILGLIEELPNTDSWRFVDATQEFEDITSPWPFTEVITIQQLVDTDMHNDFVGVKMGDVNLDATPNAFGSSTASQNKNAGLKLRVDDMAIEPGMRLAIPVNADDLVNVLGFQFTLRWNTELVSDVQIREAGLRIRDEHLGMQQAADGLIAVSWNDIQVPKIEDGTPLFYIEANAEAHATLSDIFGISSDITRAEAYNAQLHVLGVDMAWTDIPAAENDFEYALMQNRPNPFSDATTVSFSLAKAGTVQLDIYDVAGKRIYSYRGELDRGFHDLKIHKSDLKASSGVLYYQLETDNFVATKKMILLEH